MAGCNDVALVQVEVVDEHGRVVPTAADNVTFHWDDSLAFLGGGNGDPASHVADKSATRAAFHGLLLGVFGSRTRTGTFPVHATAPGLESATINIDVTSQPESPLWWCEYPVTVFPTRR